MKASNINERIRQIKDHIGRASLNTAFEDLEDLIRSIDGFDVENHDEREFINQLTVIKARFNSFNDSVIMDVGAKNTERNQITSSLLSLTDSVHELLSNNPDLIVPVKPKEITANLAIPQETETVATTNSLPSSTGADNSGCIFSFSKSTDETNVNVQANWFKILGSLGLFILAVAFGLKMIFGIGAPENENKAAPPPIDPVVIPPPEKEKDESIGTITLNHNEISLPNNPSESIKKMADMMRNGTSTGRNNIVFPNIFFEKNQVTLNAVAKKELDQMAMVLQQVSNQRMMISAIIGTDESTSYRGSKELTLGDIRSRNMYNYLKSKGVSITQMEFEGGGVSDTQKVMLELY